MAAVEAKLAALGLVLPAPLKPPAGVVLPFQFVRIVGSRAFISGHGPQNADGSVAEPLGKVGRELSLEQGHAAARLVALSMLGSLKRAIGDLDRVAAWCRVLGMVNSAAGFNRQPSVINGFSELIVELSPRSARIRAAPSACTSCRSTSRSRSRPRSSCSPRIRRPDDRRQRRIAPPLPRSLMKIVAVVLIVLGVLALAYGGFSYTDDKTAVKLGPLELSVKEKKTVNVPVWAGVGAIVAGGLLLALGGKSR